MGRTMNEAQVRMLKGGRCPNCGAEGVYSGPGGGVSADGICCKCGARYRHGPDGVTAIDEPEHALAEAGMSQERAEELEQAKLDRDAVFGKHKMAEIALDRDEKRFATLTAELDAARMKIHDYETASWADAVQAEAAWRERALVGEKALVKKMGENALLREVVELIKIRIHFIGMPQEPTYKDGNTDVVDWKHQIDMIEKALGSDGGNVEGRVIGLTQELIKIWNGPRFQIDALVSRIKKVVGELVT